MRPEVLQVRAVGIGPSVASEPEALDVCNALAQWADAAGVTTQAGTGSLAVRKSCLLSRLIYGGEAGASQTPCPVHKGRWSGIQFGWPRSVWRSADGEWPADVDPRLQEWWDAGCRCATHRGANDTTGWNPDEHCCAVPA